MLLADVRNGKGILPLFTIGTLMAPSRFLASFTQLLFLGLLQGALKLLGKAAGAVGGEVG